MDGCACRSGAFRLVIGSAGLLLRLLGDVAAVAAEEALPEEINRQDTLGTPGVRDEEEPGGLDTGRISLALQSDFTTAYFFFRGILQERNGLIWEPSGDISINVYEGGGLLSSVDLGFTVWASVHSNKTLASGSGPSNLYELDFIPRITLGWSRGLETSLAYTIFTSPNGAFNSVQEIDVGLAYDDSALLGAFALAPTATFSFETDNTAFGDKEGGYLAIAAGPSLELDFLSGEHGDYPMTMTVPLALGLSLYDYYEDGTRNDTFGFFSFGLTASVPLSFIPEDFGSWSVGAGINVLVLSTTLKNVNMGDSPFPVGTGSISMEY